MAERDALWIAAVLAADSDLEVHLRRSALLDADPHELPDPRGVEDLERVLGEHLAVDVLHQELALGVVAAVAEAHLRQVVRAEAEELGVLRDLVGGEGAAR